MILHIFILDAPIIYYNQSVIYNSALKEIKFNNFI